jgi:hypothetical protein
MAQYSKLGAISKIEGKRKREKRIADESDPKLGERLC